MYFPNYRNFVCHVASHLNPSSDTSEPPRSAHCGTLRIHKTSGALQPPPFSNTKLADRLSEARGKPHPPDVLTFGGGAHHPRLVAVVTVPGDKLPAPALQQRVLVAVAAQALVVEQSRARPEIGVLESGTDFTEETRNS